MSFSHVALAAALLWTAVRGDDPCFESSRSRLSKLMNSTGSRNSSISCVQGHRPVHQVRMYRHCVRSTSTKVTGANPEYTHLQNYTDLPMPDWNTPLKWCTAQGAVLIEREGQKLKKQEPKMEVSKLRVLVDSVQRDATTANSLLQGLAGKGEVYTASVEYYPLLFNAVAPNTGAGVCHGPDTELVTVQRQQRLDTTPMPMGIGPAHSMNQTRYSEVLDIFESLFGIGAAGPLRNLTNPPIIERKTGELMGAAIVLKFLATNLLFAYASGIPHPTHTPVSQEQILELASWIDWQRRVTAVPAFLTPQKACGALSIITALQDKSGHRSVIHVGHDTDLDALAHFFQIAWQAPPYPASTTTPPGSSLAFTPRGNNTASVQFTYQVFDSTNDPEVKVVPTVPSQVDLLEVQTFIEKQIMEFAGGDCLQSCKRLVAKL